MKQVFLGCVIFLPYFGTLCGGDTAAKEWYTERLYGDWAQTFRMQKKLHEETSDQQHIILFENETFGTVLAIDGIIQTTEKDEAVYHEMMTHIPLLAHGNARTVLVIGGGDGGIIREVLRHKTIEKVVLVEIDESVITFSQKHLSKLSQGAFKDPRVEIVIQDGAQFVKTRSEKFDVIICDSTDATGPGAVLFTQEFYGDCHNLLTPSGILVNQNGVPFMQQQELIDTLIHRKIHFADVGFYLGVIPTYVGGYMAFGWATDHKAYREVSIEELTKRLHNIEGELYYYTPSIHKAAFILPKFMEDALQRTSPQ